MKVLSLFSGVGGFDMGLENAGMETVFQCEWDKHCRTILDRHWPTVPKWDDVSTLTGEHILAHAPVIDIVAWGSPCQDLSVAGKRAGLEGGRSNLFYEGMRIITELRKASNGKYPRISIWENVYGALNSNKGDDFEAILKEMVEAGSLLCEWRVLDAQYFGIPQRRRRVFVVAVFDSATAARCPDPLLPVSEGLRWHPKTGATKREESADTPSTSIRSSRAIIGSDIVNPLAASDWKFPQQQQVHENKCVVETVMVAFSHTQGLDAQPSESAWPTLRKEGNGHAVAIPIQDGREIEKNQNGLGVAGEGAPAYTIDQTGAQAVAYGIQGNMIGRQDHNGPAGKGHTDEGDPMFTLNTTDKHAVATTMAVRRLTPLECERLMGWPDDHTRHKADGTEQADTHRYKQCGNGVASPVAQWIGEQLINL